MAPPEDAIRRYMEISTCHIKEDDDELLWIFGVDPSRCRKIGLFVSAFDFGHHIALHSDIKDVGQPYFDRLMKEGLSKEFCSILEWAYKAGCSMVSFDRDGTVIEELPKFDW